MDDDSLQSLTAEMTSNIRNHIAKLFNIDTSSDDLNNLTIPEREPSYNYVFRNPFASHIYRIIGPDETLSILHQINESQSAEKRLPTEVLLRINKEVHRNATHEEIRTTWSAIPGIQRNFSSGFLAYAPSPLQIRLDPSARKYIPVETRLPGPMSSLLAFLPGLGGTSIDEMYCQVSSADILYRLRCYFPEITINSALDRYKCVWEVYLRHNQTGMLLSFSDHKGAATLRSLFDVQNRFKFDDDTRKEIEQAFLADSVVFLNSLFGTPDGSRRLSFYHPSADADFPTDNDRYIAVPVDYVLPRCNEGITSDSDDEDLEAERPRFNPRFDVYKRWRTTKVSDSDLSSFHSILQELKYDIPSRTIDRLNGTSDLTTIISSPLLFYRLICKFMLGRTHVNVNQATPITSVWQIQLVRKTTGASIIFMDDYGVFDIRADEKSEEIMDDIAALVEALCSDSCTHPYDYVLAGCVA